MYKILDTINSPSDIQSLKLSELEILAKEIRDFLISTVCETGGHLAPNLGAVELTLALHKVFDAPRDKFVWDVGHQAYVHKILTGRRDRFHTLRQFEGISGFPKVSESEYDHFGVGHSSTSISAALGLATARDIQGKNYKVVAIIGDGSMTGGLAFEGLNNAGASKRDLIVVLNDNNMSISPNVGALSNALNQVIATPIYNRMKDEIWDLTGKLPLGKGLIRDTAHKLQDGLKNMLLPGALFERLGFRYFGPIDGHNLNRTIRLFQEVKKLNGPLFVHVMTQKGKGYKFAEENATKFHGLGSFCKETGDTQKKTIPSYTEVFGKTLVEIAEKNEKVVGITAAMADGTGLIHMANRFPNRFFDVGIAEQHAVTFAAALGLQGLKPVVAIYSTFLQRAYDQVIHDVALQNVPVVFAMDRGGLVGEDGPTHHGSFDLSYLRLVPNLVIMAPKDENELRDMLWTAIQHDGPIALRYPRGEGLGVPLKKNFDFIPIGKSEVVRHGKDVAILAVGDRVEVSRQLADRLSEHGIDAEVINARFVKPLDEDMLHRVSAKYPLLVTVENNSIVGGLGGAVAEYLTEKNCHIGFHRFGLPDAFVPHGSRTKLMELLKLDVAQMAEEVMHLLKAKSNHHRLKFPKLSLKTS